MYIDVKLNVNLKYFENLEHQMWTDRKASWGGVGIF